MFKKAFHLGVGLACFTIACSLLLFVFAYAYFVYGGEIESDPFSAFYRCLMGILWSSVFFHLAHSRLDQIEKEEE